MLNKITVDNYPCTRCGAAKGENCKTPDGEQRMAPHGNRLMLLTQEDWKAINQGRTNGNGVIVTSVL